MFFYKKINNKALKVFFIYTIFLSLFATSSIITLYNYSNQSFYYSILKLYTLVEFVLFSLFFYLLLHSLLAKRILILSIGFFLVFNFASMVTNKDTFSVYPLLIEFIFFIIYIIYYFYEQMKKNEIIPIYTVTGFWICVGLFIYFSGNFFFLLFSTLQADFNLKSKMQLVYILVTLTKNIIIFISFFGNWINRIEEKKYNFPEDLNLDTLTPNNNTK